MGWGGLSALRQGDTTSRWNSAAQGSGAKPVIAAVSNPGKAEGFSYLLQIPFLGFPITLRAHGDFIFPFFFNYMSHYPPAPPDLLKTG